MMRRWSARARLAARAAAVGAGGALALGIALGAAPTPAGAVITGVCPDGSMFIVQTQAAIPCAEAKQVAPDKMPPVRPEYLPRPYRWQQHQRRQDPNNPYNLVEDVRRSRRAAQAAQEEGRAQEAPAPPAVSSGPPELARGPAPQARPRPTPPPRLARPIDPAVALALNPDELRDLLFIVELSQDRAPASFVRANESGDESLYLALAHSQAFEMRFRDARLAPGRRVGPVLLFSALAREATAFHANLFFSQGHLTFQPDKDELAQFGVLEGELGDLPPESVVLGYVVLPPAFDASAPVDVYWNDRRVQAVLRPR